MSSLTYYIVSDYSDISIQLPKDLIKEAKQYALDHDTNMTSIVIEALRQYLAKTKK